LRNEYESNEKTKALQDEDKWERNEIGYEMSSTSAFTFMESNWKNKSRL